MPLEIALVAAPTEEAATLIGELEAELSALYSAEQRHGLAVAAIFQPHIRFFIARLDGAPVGCGGVALFSDFAEVKRMYVREALRGQGVADAIMARLIDETRNAGFSILRLETGVHSHAAIHFYARHGFETCTIFAPYSAMAPASVVTSAFMEKLLVS